MKPEAEILELKSLVNILADELANYTGGTVPGEIEKARAALTGHAFKSPDPRSRNQEECLVCGRNIRAECHFQGARP